MSRLTTSRISHTAQPPRPPRRTRAGTAGAVLLALTVLVPLAGCAAAANPSAAGTSSAPVSPEAASRGAAAPGDSPSTTGSRATVPASATWRYALQISQAHIDDASSTRTVPVFTLQGAPGGLPAGDAARVDQELAAAVRAQVARFDSELAGLPAGGGPPSLTISGRTVTERAWLLAVRLDVAADYGGANPEVTVDSLVFDLRSGAQIRLADLFGAHLSPVDTALRAALGSLPDAFGSEVAAVRATDLAWWPAPDGLHLVADQCRVLPCAAGPVEVTLGWAKLPAPAQQSGQPLLPW